MKNLKLEKVRTLIANDKIDEAIKQMLAIASEINNTLYKDAISLSARFKKWDKRDSIIGDAEDKERNRIVDGLLRTVDNSEEEINQLILEAEEAEKEGNYRVAISNVERVLVIVEDESLRDYKVSLTENILEKAPVTTPKEDNFSFFWVLSLLLSLQVFSP